MLSLMLVLYYFGFTRDETNSNNLLDYVKLKALRGWLHLRKNTTKQAFGYLSVKQSSFILKILI